MYSSAIMFGLVFIIFGLIALKKGERRKGLAGIIGGLVIFCVGLVGLLF